MMLFYLGYSLLGCIFRDFNQSWSYSVWLLSKLFGDIYMALEYSDFIVTYNALPKVADIKMNENNKEFPLNSTCNKLDKGLVVKRLGVFRLLKACGYVYLQIRSMS